jgi:ABC-2 type transport system ATP-binding protein
MIERKPVYKIDNLTKVYKNGNVTANNGISLEINEGEIFGIFGPNGAGKTTLVRQMAGLIKPTSGSILLRGMDVIKEPSVIPHHVAYFAQAPWILWSLKVWETIYFTGIFRGMSKKEARKQTGQLMEELGLTDIRERLMERLSGGQSRLLGIAATLIGSCPILILDEPTNELDPINRVKVWNLFSRLCKEKGVTIILVTHNVLEAEQVVDRVMIVDYGKIIAIGTPGQLKSRVDDRIRILIKFKPNNTKEPEELLSAFGDYRKMTEDRWRLSIPRDQVSNVYERLLKKIDIRELDDFRMMTTTLEDVYIQMGGGGNTDEFHA